MTGYIKDEITTQESNDNYWVVRETPQAKSFWRSLSVYPAANGGLVELLGRQRWQGKWLVTGHTTSKADGPG